MAHNEPVERAQEETGKVTARQLLAVVRSGVDSLYTHGRAAHNRPSYSDAFVFTVSSVRKDTNNKVESITKVDVPGEVHGGSTSHRKEHPPIAGDPFSSRWLTYDEGYRPIQGFWSMSRSRLVDVLELLPGDAEVSLDLILDGGTNEYLIRAESPMNFGNESGLDTDFLYLVAETKSRGKSKVRRFLIDVSTGPHNTARFGGPKYDQDKGGGAR